MLFTCFEMAKAKLVQIYYEESQLSKLYPFAEPYYNDKLTIFFENDCIVKLVSETKADKIAVCSWKLREKFRWYIGRPRELTQELLESDYEVMSFTKNTKEHRMLSAAEQWHPGFLKTFDKILSAIGKTRPSEIKIPIYQNHFSAKREIYVQYVKNYLSPAMQSIMDDVEINNLAMQDSKYSDLTNQSAEHLQKKIGVNYYPLVPFLLERLFSVYVQNEGLKITHI